MKTLSKISRATIITAILGFCFNAQTLVAQTVYDATKVLGEMQTQIKNIGQNVISVVQLILVLTFIVFSAIAAAKYFKADRDAAQNFIKVVVGIVVSFIIITILKAFIA